MPRKPNPETQRKIAQVDQLIRDYNMSIPTACEKAELSPSTYHSALTKRREREEEAKAWAHVGKSIVDENRFQLDTKESK